MYQHERQRLPTMPSRINSFQHFETDISLSLTLRRSVSLPRIKSLIFHSLTGVVHCSNSELENQRNERERACSTYWKDSRERIEIYLEYVRSMLEY